MESEAQYTEPLADFSQRAFGRAIDFLTMAVFTAPFALGTAGGGDSSDIPRWVYALTFAVWFFYETILVTKLGRTVGKMATLTRVADKKTGQNPSLPQAAIRSAVLVGLVMVLGVWGLLILVTAVADQQTRRGALDWLAGTVVVKAPPKGHDDVDLTGDDDFDPRMN